MFSAGVFAHIHMAFEITQLWRQITGSSLQGRELSSFMQMFTFGFMTHTQHASSCPVWPLQHNFTCAFGVDAAHIDELIKYDISLNTLLVYLPLIKKSVWDISAQFCYSSSFLQRVFLQTGDVCFRGGHGSWRLLWPFRSAQTWRSASNA